MISLKKFQNGGKIAKLPHCGMMVAFAYIYQITINWIFGKVIFTLRALYLYTCTCTYLPECLRWAIWCVTVGFWFFDSKTLKGLFSRLTIPAGLALRSFLESNFLTGNLTAIHGWTKCKNLRFVRATDFLCHSATICTDNL